MITLAMALALQAGAHELVVRFPGNSMGYNRTFRSRAACDRARQAIIDEHNQRVARQHRDARAQGGIFILARRPTRSASRSAEPLKALGL